MVNELAELVTGQSVATWILIAFLVFYFIYKEWPDFRKRVSSGAVKETKEEANDRSVGERLDSIEADVKEIQGKLQTDYLRLNQIEGRLDKTKETQGGLVEELEIIMRALLGVLRGLQEQGANGPTKEAEIEIQEYLTRKAHHISEKE